jgi:hypothetical protein
LAVVIVVSRRPVFTSTTLSDFSVRYRRRPAAHGTPEISGLVCVEKLGGHENPICPPAARPSNVHRTFSVAAS